ncbi:hypothetical protein GCM10028810_32050 [Spirosoma litoris]
MLALLVTGLWSCNEDTYVDPVVLTQVRGQVLYSQDRSPIRNASVKLTPSSRIVATDSAGIFHFDSVIAGKYTLQASKTGYGTEVATIETNASTSPAVTILLTDDKTQNRPPTIPTVVSPAINSLDQPTSLTLSWQATDPNRDTLTYSVLLFSGGSTTPTRSYTGLTVDSLVVTDLAYNTSYLWQVIASDGIATVNGPVWSFHTAAYPDYSYLFARRVNGYYQIFAADGTGSFAQLTSEGSNWRPVASPNRQLIAFISNVDTDLQLYVMNPNGSDLRRVTSVPLAGLSPTDLSFSWSPDGSQLLYPNNNRLMIVNLDGTGLRVMAQAPPGRVFAGCDWTAQGNLIVARTTGTSLYDSNLMLFSATDGGSSLIYSSQLGRVGNPVFSVSGTSIAFTYDVSGFQNMAGRQLDSRLFLLNLATGDTTDVSTIATTNNQSQNSKQAGTNDIDPRFSPNGALLIFTNVDNTGLGERTVFTVDLARRTRSKLFQQAEMPYYR